MDYHSPFDETPRVPNSGSLRRHTTTGGGTPRDFYHMTFSAITGSRAFKLLRATSDDWMEDKALRLSAALAYYSLFSIAPLLVIAISIAGLALGDTAVRGQLSNQLNEYIGPQAAASVQSMVQSASKPSSGWTGMVVGFATMMLGAAGVFGQLKDALNTIWEVEPIGGGGVWRFLRERLLIFGMVLAIGLLLLMSLMMTTVMASLGSYFEGVTGIPPIVGGLVGFLLSFTIVTVLFALIFKVLPDVRIEWRSVWIGALVTALLFELGKFGLSYYLGREGTASSFGAAGSVVLLVLWVYYSSGILLFGAEFTQVYARDSGHQILPSLRAVAVSAENRAQQGMAPIKAEEARQTEVRTRIIEVALPPAGRNPIGLLFAVTTATFLIGLLARRRAEEVRDPYPRVRDGLKGLGGQAAGQLAEVFDGARRAVARHFK